MLLHRAAQTDDSGQAEAVKYQGGVKKTIPELQLFNCVCTTISSVLQMLRSVGHTYNIYIIYTHVTGHICNEDTVHAHPAHAETATRGRRLSSTPRAGAWADVAWHGQNKAQRFFAATLSIKAAREALPTTCLKAPRKPIVTTPPGQCQQKSVWVV